MSDEISIPGLSPTPKAPKRPVVSAVSGASHRLRALAALSGSLTDALGPKEAVDLVEQKALSALDATSAVVVTLGAFPPPESMGMGAHPTSHTLHIVHAIGLSAPVRAALDQSPLAAQNPLAEVARTGEPVFLNSEAEFLWYPEWGIAMLAAGARAAASVPVWANGELRGVLGLSWAQPRVFDEDERAFVLTLGVMCAQAIMRAHLRGAERHAREVAEEANRSKAHFVATISHELRTPMNAVLGYTELIAEEICGPVTPIQKQHLGRVRDTGKHLLGLIEDLLRYARVEAGEEIVSPEELILRDIMEQSVQLVRPIALSKGVGMRITGAEQLVPLFTDPRKLRQILVNLLANAVKFSDVGEVVLAVRVAGLDTTLRVHFDVTDTGRGITVQDQEHIFEPFWKSDPQSGKTGSTGLGLSVARQLARLLGGDITATSAGVGLGSTFLLSLPARYAGGERTGPAKV